MATSAARAAAIAVGEIALSFATTVSVAIADEPSDASACRTPSSGVTVVNGMTSELPPQQPATAFDA